MLLNTKAPQVLRECMRAGPGHGDTGERMVERCVDIMNRERERNENMLYEIQGRER